MKCISLMLCLHAAEAVQHMTASSVLSMQHYDTDLEYRNDNH